MIGPIRLFVTYKPRQDTLADSAISFPFPTAPSKRTARRTVADSEIFYRADPFYPNLEYIPVFANANAPLDPFYAPPNSMQTL